MNRRILQFLLSLALLLVAAARVASAAPNLDLFTPAERAWIAAHPVVHIAVDPDWRPLEYVENGVHKGLTAEYVAAISDLTGIRFSLVPGQSWADARQALIDGRVDLLPAISRQFAPPSLKDIVLFSEPYFVGSTIILATQAEPIIFDARKLNGKVVAIKGGGAYERLLRGRFPEIRLLPLESPEAALQAVADGRAAAAVGVDTAMLPLLRRKYLDTLHISGAIGDLPATVSMGVRKELPELASIVEKSLESLTARQTDNMVEKWLKGTDYGAPSWRTLLKYYGTELIFLAVAIILILLFAQRARNARRAAVQSEQTKTRFLAVMSHEIRTPMNAILSSVELLRRSPLDRRQHELADMAGSASETLLNLLDDVLDLSKLEAHRLLLEEVPTDISALARQAAGMMRVKAEEKKLALQLELPEPGDRDVVIDPARVRQVLINLLSNAIKFTDRGGVTLSIRLLDDAPAPQPQATLQVAVADTGIGLSAEQQARLFQPFVQADSSTTRRYGGTGLGLVICRELIEAMKGTLDFHSEAGVGTVVTFSIPVAMQPRLSVQPASAGVVAPAVAVAAAAAGPTILVVDDHPNNRQVIQRQLEELNCNAVLVADGPSALALLETRQFPLVLLDCYLPGMDGYQVARTIRAREQGSGRHQPIIAISAAVDTGHVQRCMESGMDGVLKKPLRLNELQSIVEAWCDVELALREHPPSSPVSDPVELFRDAAQLDMADIECALESGDFDMLARYIHRMKGAALIAGESMIAEASGRMEEILRSASAGDRAMLDSVCSELRTQVAQL
ncbi:transporter substrate-binding domain-containing protein [Collimonas sp. H4R21]|uniref:histidine kinase n=1 Tax=Collimonas rhizosphaerae TaxID=3126357 RepID=A0ABU9PYT0_9BURK